MDIHNFVVMKRKMAEIFIIIFTLFSFCQCGEHPAAGKNTSDNATNAPTTPSDSSNRWIRKADFGGVGRYSAVGFSIGIKGYILTGKSGHYSRDLLEYDPSSNTWTRKADFPGTPRDRAVGFSIGTN